MVFATQKKIFFQHLGYINLKEQIIFDPISLCLEIILKR